jgi:PAS domain S-box-containing protein
MIKHPPDNTNEKGMQKQRPFSKKPEKSDPSQNVNTLKEYQDLFEYAPIGIIQSTPDGKLLKANPALIRMLGYSPEQGDISSIQDIGRDLFVSPERRKKMVDLQIKQDRVMNFETQFRCKDGSIIAVKLHGRSAKRKDGSVKYLEAFVEDITQQKKIAETLAENEKRYRSVFENTGTATVIIEEDTTISLANSRFERLTGYAKEEIEGKIKWPAIVANDEDREMMLNYHHKRRQDARDVPREYEFTLIDKYGYKKNIFSTVDMIPGTRRSVSSFIDVTQIKRISRSLQESESKLSGIVEIFEGFHYICSKDYRITYLNKALEAYIGQNHMGEICHQALYGLDSPCDWCEQERVFKGETTKNEIESPRDGRWYYALSSPVYEMDDTIGQKQTLLIDIHERKQKEFALIERETYLEKENIRLRAAMKDRYKFGNIIGKSPAMQKIYEVILRAAAVNANVIVYGPSGTGKELVAQAIHDSSDRSKHPFVPVNCGAIPKNLMESEFFGYKKGAFTGADNNKNGFLDQADKGTLFLDEIGEIAEEMQVKLLRVLDGHGYTPVGSVDLRKPDVRIISATNRKLQDLLEKGRFREDFFYRIHIIPIHLPPLRDRKEDIPLLVEHFLKIYGGDKGPATLRGSELELLLNYDWPGNVRELEGTIQRFVSLGSLDFMGMNYQRLKHIPEANGPYNSHLAPELPLKEAVSAFERDHILNLLAHNQWNRTRVAELLGVERKTLYLKMKQLNIQAGHNRSK